MGGPAPAMSSELLSPETTARPTRGQRLRPGQVLQGTYEVVRLAGQGGMGEVYETRHLRIPGRFAVKLLHQHGPLDGESLASFRREAEITSSLRHPNIVQVLDFNQLPDGSPYIVMEFLDGMDLAQRLKSQGVLPPFEVVRHISQMAAALAAAHEHGVVHRDLKPQNVFLVPMAGQTGEHVKILDFGISSVRGALPGPDAPSGTPRYMSPEQALGDAGAVDGRTDQFALAAIAYEMLTGHEAFRGDSVGSVLFNLVHGAPVPLPEPVRAMVGELGEATLQRAMARRPEDRFPGVLEFASALEEAVLWGGQQTPQPVPVAAPPPPAPRRITPTTIALGAIAALGWAVALTSPRAVEDRVTRLAAPLVDGAQQLQMAVRPSQLVYVEILRPPPGLTATVDGQPSPLPISLVRGTAAYRLRFQAPGYQPYETLVDAVADQALELPMLRKRRPAR
jgi:serine/threonine protein kinase